MRKLDRSLESIEAQKSRLIERVSALDTQRQRIPPNSRVWSPLQIVEHLMLAEKEYLHFIEEGAKQGVQSKRPSRSLMIPLVAYLMRKRISFPTIPAMEPGNEPRPLPELIAEWDQVRTAFRGHLAGVSEEKKDIPLALNPLFGPLTAEQVLALMEAHLEYHLAQVPRA